MKKWLVYIGDTLNISPKHLIVLVVLTALLAALLRGGLRSCQRRPDPLRQAADSAFFYVEKANEHRDSAAIYYEKYLRAKELYDSPSVDSNAYRTFRDSLRAVVRERVRKRLAGQSGTVRNAETSLSLSSDGFRESK